MKNEPLQLVLLSNDRGSLLYAGFMFWGDWFMVPVDLYLLGKVWHTVHSAVQAALL